MKNYGNRGGCCPSRLSAEVDNILRDLHSSSYDTKAKSNNFFIFIQNNSQFKNIAKTSLPPSMLSLSSIVHVQGCSVPQMRDSRCRPSSCLLAVLAMFLATISPILTLETGEMSAIFVFTNKTTQPRPQVFSINCTLTCTKAARSTSSVH